MFKFLHRTNDPITSIKAAFQTQDFIKDHEEVIVACLRRFGPLGKDGIASRTGLNSSQVARRLSNLKKAGFIDLTGREVLSNSNKKEREWKFQPVQQTLI